jgi:hypothetical protein
MYDWLLTNRNLRRRIKKYPEFDGLPEDEAVGRLRFYIRTERNAMEPWYSLSFTLIVGGLIGVLVLIQIGLSGVLDSRIVWGLQLMAMILPMLLMSRVNRRLRRRIALEIAAGRILDCIECGYDLRHTEGNRCPECGADISGRVVPVAPPEPEQAEPNQYEKRDLPRGGFEQWKR